MAEQLGGIGLQEAVTELGADSESGSDLASDSDNVQEAVTEVGGEDETSLSGPPEPEMGGAAKNRVRDSLFGGDTPKKTIGEGSVLADRFRLDSLLGQGGMGAVWKATHLSLRSSVAIKLIEASLLDTAEGRTRFMREAQAAAGIRSPHVVQIFDFGVHDESIPFIAMELLEGESLGDRLKNKGALSSADTLEIMTHVCRGIGAAHQRGIIHRDLKPDNIFIVEQAHDEVSKVLDFGLAKATDQLNSVSDGTPTRTGAVMGTPYYMSPEQAEDAKDVDSRTDLWALGVITYQCMVGARPFQGDSFTSVLLKVCNGDLPVPSEHAQVPAHFDAWFAKACARNVDSRFADAGELINALKQVLSGDGSAASLVALNSAAGSAAADSLSRGEPSKAKLFAAVSILGAAAVATAVALMGPGEPEPMAAPAQIEAAPDVATPEPKAEEPAVPEVSEAEEAALETLQRGIDETQTSTYKSAIDALNRAYIQLGKLEKPTSTAQAARVETLYRLAHARRKLGEREQDEATLNTAKENLNSFVADSEGKDLPLKITADDVAAETAAIDEAIAALAEAKKAAAKPVKRKKKTAKKKTPEKDKWREPEF
jgi:serine/threonine-protein kinase